MVQELAEGTPYLTYLGLQFWSHPEEEFGIWISALSVQAASTLGLTLS